MAAGPHRGGALLNLEALARQLLPTRRQVRGVLRRPFRRADPAAWSGPTRWRDPLPPVVFVCVYRPSHAADVARVVEQLAALEADVRLWALETEDPALAEHTLGSGPGMRTELMNQLYGAAPCSPDAVVVLWDDDVAFERGDLPALLRAVQRGGFDLAQPTHAPGGHRSWPFTFSRPLCLARWVTWIEVGPVVVVAPSWRDRVLPFPEGFGMGWGIEVLWHELGQEGCRLGMVDAVAILHLLVVGSDYDERPERVRARRVMDERGVASAGDLQRVLGTWRPWRRTPPWERS